MKFIKKGKVLSWDKPNKWWQSHTMAPTAVYLNGKIRVYLGAWDGNGISRITYIDLDAKNPGKVLYINDNKPIVDIGRDGMFDDNGVFPAHAVVIDGEIFLYYTGFQKGFKIPHYNFGGLAKSKDGNTFERVSEAPVLDRTDEGLLVRAGQSVLKEDGVFRTVYSMGSGFIFVGGKERPTYDIAYQESDNGIDFKRKGIKILECNYEVEHGLGRPQICKIRDIYYVFYTRRMIDMKYFIGCAYSTDASVWMKHENVFSEIHHSESGFDSEMIYFPSVVYVPDFDKYLLFYCGNNFGKTGIGFAELLEG